MKTITLEMPDDLVSREWASEEEFARGLRLAAAIHWYGQGAISQGKAAEVAGITRQAFIEALYEAQVPACQATVEDIEEELRRGISSDR